MRDEDFLYPGFMSRMLYKFVGDPLNLYGGNLLGTYKISETQTVPAIAIEDRSPSVLSVNGIEIIIEAIPRNIQIESVVEMGLNVKIEWGFYVVNKTGNDADLVRILLRLLKCLNTGEVHLLNTDDKIKNGSQFFYSFNCNLTIDNIPSSDCGLCDFVLPEIPCLPDLNVPVGYYEGLNFDIAG
jgi:hypothetical protein